MKYLTLLLSLTLIACSCAARVDIDWSQVRPIEEFDHYRARLSSNIHHPSVAANPNRRIVNGQEATPGQFPYQVALLGQFNQGVGLCGGSIITNNYVLTAAHCVHSGTNSNNPIVSGVAIVGAHNRMIEEPSQQRITFTSAGIVGHPGYDLFTFRHDIAVIRLDEPIVYTDRVQPIRLPARSDTRSFAGFIGTVSGYGVYDTANPGLSDVLNYVANPVMTNADCIAQWTPQLVEDQNICHSGDGGRAACNSDSGGPLTVPDGGSLLVGVVAFGSGTGCDSGIATVFMRVSYYLEWIEANSDFVADP
ncbi:AGAP002432-PA-like protein [Anopheles sinensis]|uniref:AGAP002432-PA-like protein n=1 Tax=Anopheles sinensis TaxID=74873 RepID=A0A084VQU6_ANOSI|nr:AGAP002432-PA-like protein [Anopheles sinensis]